MEFLDLVEPLTSPDDPAEAFHVVCPSLPATDSATPGRSRLGSRAHRGRVGGADGPPRLRALGGARR
ncbi:hypothetical protein ACFQV4_20940 [Streptomyces thermocarboxydus]